MTKKALGEYIKNRRQELGISQKELADELNVAFQTVSKWENGKCYPDIELFPEISRVLDVSEQKLFDEAKRPVANSNVLRAIIIGADALIVLCLIVGIAVFTMKQYNKSHIAPAGVNSEGTTTEETTTEESQQNDSQEEPLTTVPDIELGKRLNGVSKILPLDTVIWDVKEQKEETVKGYDFGFPNSEERVKDVRWIGYAMVDMDQDGTDEIVVELSTGYDGYWLILQKREEKYYGYRLNYRAMTSLDEDGVAAGSSGAAYSDGYRMEFAEDGLKTLTVWSYDGNNGVYKIRVNGNLETVTYEEYSSYMKERSEKIKKVEFIDFDE